VVELKAAAGRSSGMPRSLLRHNLAEERSPQWRTLSASGGEREHAVCLCRAWLARERDDTVHG
jgi:hypothetical protein